MNKGVSVVIPCYNSSKLLPETIAHLARQNVPEHINWEIIIVDNASTDDTAETAAAIWDACKSRVPFKVVEQPIKGLSAARDKGFQEARFEYILFCDDDNWLDPNYVRVSYEIMTGNPLIGVLGGAGEKVTEGTFPPLYDNLYGFGPQNDKDGEVSDKRGWVFGAGFVVRKSAWNLINNYGFKSFLTDRKGKKLSGGGDVELCFAIRLAGYKVWYDHRLKFKHFFPSNRLHWNYYTSLQENTHRAVPILQAYKFVLNNNGEMYKTPDSRYWLYRSYKLMIRIRKLLKSVVKSYFYDVEGDKNIIKYYRFKGELIGWLQVRSKYSTICDQVNAFKNNLLNSSQ